eukprot:SAG22_NODE_4768_length_1169_cov_1.242991_1_plen_265_part_01
MPAGVRRDGGGQTKKKKKVLVIADVHGNATALEAVLRDAGDDCDITIFLGDSVLSGPQVHETMALLQALHRSGAGGNSVFICGNHDHEMLHPETVQNYPPNWKALNDWIFGQLQPGHYAFVRDNYRTDGDYLVCGLRLRLCHGAGTRGGDRNALPSSSDERLSSMHAGSTSPTVLFGHSHVQFERSVAGVRYINPGSVGQNRTGQGGLACYGVFVGGVYEPHQVWYDVQPVLAAYDRVDTLDGEHEKFREWLKAGVVEGFGIGKT